mmetsp:Transcript_1327/g.1771  ORF Transcript_1327/g.1771 Transcript_1327/m.1771 type:complete len:288 (+) Transcript_1327:787-1650(+)
MVNMAARPLFSSPTSQPLAPSKFMTQVAEPLMPIFFSMEPQLKLLRSPREPSSFTRNLGTRNMEMPFGPFGASGSLASTRWMMFSAMSCSPQVIKILVPVTLKEPSSFGSALVRMIPRSVPAWGSVRSMAPDQTPEYMLGRYFSFSSSLPWASSARQAPAVSMGASPNAMLAPCIISSNCATRVLGMPMPPKSGLPPRPFQPPSTMVWYASLKPSGDVTSPSFHLQPCSSPSRFRGASTPLLILPASSRMASAVSGSTCSATLGSEAHSAGASKTSFRTKRMSRRGA